MYHVRASGPVFGDDHNLDGCDQNKLGVAAQPAAGTGGTLGALWRRLALASGLGRSLGSALSSALAAALTAALVLASCLASLGLPRPRRRPAAIPSPRLLRCRRRELRRVRLRRAPQRKGGPCLIGAAGVLEQVALEAAQVDCAAVGRSHLEEERVNLECARGRGEVKQRGSNGGRATRKSAAAWP
eukprot:scaffold1266_cov92-Isochrysis_galbana.AAC.2